MARSRSALSLCALLVLASFNIGAGQQTPPSTARAPPPGAQPPAAAFTPPATPGATTAPPRVAPAGVPPQPSATTQARAPPTTAPTFAPPTVAPPTVARPATVPSSSIPALAPNRGPTGSISNTVPAVAPGPATPGSGIINSTISVVSPGALSQQQQTDLCNVIVSNLSSSFPTVRSCGVTSQTASEPATFAANGRRLQQQSSGTVTLSLGIQLSFAATSQVAAIQVALSNLRINIGTQTTIITVINIIFQQTTTITTTTVVAPTNVVALSSSTTITVASASSANTTVTVVNAVPPTATGNTTINVTPANAKPPAAPANGTTTTTTITNSTTTTTVTTIAFFSVTTQVTIIQQYYFTIQIGGSTGVLIIINFNLNGNVVLNLPPVVTGGATTGQTTTVRVTGATSTIVRSTTITSVVQSTSSTTTTSTTTTGSTTTSSTTGGTTTNTNTNTNTNGTTPPAPTVINGVTKQVCSVPFNPYGAVPITADEGTLKKGGFLISSWNDLNNNPGQGNLIYQCLPNGTTTIWANVTVKGACARDNAGVGLTMALSKCGPNVYAGSLPIIPPVSAGKIFPGCLIALDTSGRVVNEVKAPGINGPWGSCCTYSDNRVNIAISSVLSGFSNQTTNTTATGGRKLLQSAAPTGGILTRYSFSPPTNTSWDIGQGTVIASNISTNGSATAVSNGAVGPGACTIGDEGTIYLPDNNGNRSLAIPNGMAVTSPNSVVTLSVTNSGMNGPNSLTFRNNQLLGTNTQDGKLFFINLNSARNGGTGSSLQVDPGNNAGVLFQAVYSVDSTLGAPVGSIWFQHDGSSTFNTVINSGSPVSAPGSAPTGSRPSPAPASG